MKYPIIFFLCVFGFIGTLLLLTRPDDEPASKRPEITDINSVSINKCYDAAMGEWFQYFNEFQTIGYTMEEASVAAEKLAIKKYNSCEIAQAYIKSLPNLTVEL